MRSNVGTDFGEGSLAEDVMPRIIGDVELAVLIEGGLLETDAGSDRSCGVDIGGSRLELSTSDSLEVLDKSDAEGAIVFARVGGNSSP